MTDNVRELLSADVSLLAHVLMSARVSETDDRTRDSQLNAPADLPERGAS